MVVPHGYSDPYARAKDLIDNNILHQEQWTYLEAYQGQYVSLVDLIDN